MGTTSLQRSTDQVGWQSVISKACDSNGSTVVELLNETGIWTELDSVFLGRVALSKTALVLENLRRIGYCGQALICVTRRFQGEGWLYALYNPARYEREEAMAWIVHRFVVKHNVIPVD